MTLNVTTVLTDTFNITKPSRLYSKKFGLNSQTFEAKNFGFLAVVTRAYPNTKMSVIGLITTPLLFDTIFNYAKVIPKFTAEFINVFKPLVVTIDAKPIKQYLANFWS